MIKEVLHIVLVDDDEDDRDFFREAIEEIDMENVKKAPLEDVLSLYDLLDKLSNEPVLLHKISDHELEFYTLTTPQIMEIRTLFAEKNKTKQNKMLKEFKKSLTQNSSGGGGGGDETTQTGGKSIDVDVSAILATFI